MFKKNTMIYTVKDVNLDIALLADLHANKNTDYTWLYKNATFLRNGYPDFIAVLGDMLDDGLDYESAKRVSDILDKYREIAPVVMINGNHDLITKKDGKWKVISTDEELKVGEQISNLYRSIPNVSYLLNDSVSFPFKNVNFYGANPNIHYYDDEYSPYDTLEDSVIKQFDSKVDNDNFNIFLTHSPKSFMDNTFIRGYSLFDNMDLFLSGHMHNGVVPIYFEKFIPSHYGLVGFSRKKKILFPELAKGTVNINETAKGIIANPYCTISNGKGKVSSLNSLFPPVSQTVKVRKRIK
ncbi:MAG: metallophosphoesterase [Bacilli bacterium]|nr:metallophosphoesterase [Bacilli bacterium]